MPKAFYAITMQASVIRNSALVQSRQLYFRLLAQFRPYLGVAFATVFAVGSLSGAAAPITYTVNRGAKQVASVTYSLNGVTGRFFGETSSFDYFVHHLGGMALLLIGSGILVGAVSSLIAVHRYIRAGR